MIKFFAIFSLLWSFLVLEIPYSSAKTSKSTPSSKKKIKKKEKWKELKEFYTLDDLKKFRKLTPLEEATVTNNYPLAEKLIKKGTQVYPPDNKIGSPLYYATFHDNATMAQLLIKHGADVNFKLSNGMTPLALAVMRNQIALTQILLDNGANPKIKVQGVSLMEIAEKNYYFVIVSLLMEKGAKRTFSIK